MSKPSDKKPTVSVVIGAYNAAAHLAETLESVQAQAFHDFEIVVVDDGSTDATARVVRRFDEDVRYVYKENGGSASARNRGIEEARGRYVAFLDADDLWEPEKLERQMERFAAADAPAWAYTDAAFFTSEDGAVRYRASQRHVLREGDVLRPLLLDNFIAFSSVAARRDVLLEAGGFDTSAVHRISEDWDLWLRLAARHRVGLVRGPLTRIRQHAHRKTSTMNLQAAFKSRHRLVERAVARDPERLADVRGRAVAGVCLGIGRKYLDREERRAARRVFVQGLRGAPAAWPVWAYLLASFVPRPALRALGRLRRYVMRGYVM